MTHPDQLDLFPTTLHMTRIDPDQNMRRFYRMLLQPDLFGGCNLVREWGRIGQNGGQMRSDRFESEGLAVDALNVAVKCKIRRGYTQS